MNDTISSKQKKYATIAAFLLIGLLAIAAVVATISRNGSDATTEVQASESAENDTFESLSNLIPEPASENGYVEKDTKSQYIRLASDVTKEDFDTYIEVCENAGFSENSIQEIYSYSANNAEGYHLSIIYDGDKSMTIEINAPTVFK